MRFGDPIFVRDSAAPIFEPESQKAYHKYKMTGQNEITDYRDTRKMQTRFAVGGAARKDTKRLSHQPVHRFFSNESLASSFHG